MSAEGCPCGYSDLGVRRWSKEWHRRHMAAHLVAFPDVDERTRDNLASFIDWADA